MSSRRWRPEARERNAGHALVGASEWEGVALARGAGARGMRRGSGGGSSRRPGTRMGAREMDGFARLSRGREQSRGENPRSGCSSSGGSWNADVWLT